MDWSVSIAILNSRIWSSMESIVVTMGSSRFWHKYYRDIDKWNYLDWSNIAIHNSRMGNRMVNIIVSMGSDRFWHKSDCIFDKWNCMDCHSAADILGCWI
jgi:hypothetical protein